MPEAASSGAELSFVCAVQVRACGDESNMFKRVLVESDKWEVARAPNEVRAAAELFAQALLTAAQQSAVQLF
jgi:hypothetical protein